MKIQKDIANVEEPFAKSKMSQPNTLESYHYLLNMGNEEFEAMFGIEPMEPGPSANDVQDLSKDKDNNGKGQKKRYRRHTKE